MKKKVSLYLFLFLLLAFGTQAKADQVQVGEIG